MCYFYMKSNSNKAEFLKFNTPGVCWGNGPKLPFFNPRPSTSLEEGGAVGSATQRDSPFVKKLDLYKSLNTWTRDIVFWVVGAVPPQKSPSCLLPAGVFFFSGGLLLCWDSLRISTSIAPVSELSIFQVSWVLLIPWHVPQNRPCRVTVPNCI